MFVEYLRSLMKGVDKVLKSLLMKIHSSWIAFQSKKQKYE